MSYIKPFTKNILTTLRLLNIAKLTLEKTKRLKRKLLGIDQKLIKNYLNDSENYKLQIGCGGNALDGWLNTNYHPRTYDILHLDVTTPFPFKANTFDYIFSEHMIEHITYGQGLIMLKECFRVMKPGAKIRIVTPNLFFLIDLVKEKPSKLQKDYMQWNTENFIPSAPYDDGVFVLNNYVRNWGHLFIYDIKTLKHSLESCGFISVVKQELSESDSAELTNIENQRRMPDGFLKLESIVLEASKP